MRALRGEQPGQLIVRAVLRHFVPNKGLHPLRRCAAIPAYFAAGTICFQQTVPAAKSDNPIPSARPSTENVGGLFSSIHPIKKEVMHYDKTESRAVYYEKGDRRKRAHRLITRGAAVESVVPLAKVLSETEFYVFAEKALALPEVKGLLMEAVNEHNKNEFGGD